MSPDVGLHFAIIMEANPLYRDRAYIPTLEYRAGRSLAVTGKPVHIRTPRSAFSIHPPDERCAHGDLGPLNGSGFVAWSGNSAATLHKKGRTIMLGGANDEGRRSIGHPACPRLRGCNPRRPHGPG